jgi:hypothetical protein
MSKLLTEPRELTGTPDTSQQLHQNSEKEGFDLVASVKRSLLTRAIVDQTFRQELLEDPKGEFSRELSWQTHGAQALSRQENVRVLEDTEKIMHLVIPPVGKAFPAPDSSLNGPVLFEIANRCGLDSGFRAEMLTAPKAALEWALSQMNGHELKLPNDIDVRVIEKGEREEVLILPPAAPERINEGVVAGVRLELGAGKGPQASESAWCQTNIGCTQYCPQTASCTTSFQCAPTWPSCTYSVCT